eukprot:TRINITY_DN11102_c0_g4_i1.p1 TRINITY_DN11102_c0_g4~~TRINITY_DN11102_c0_g4_i1.p1  ORF type:complete len:484 (+),score=-17.01 TRINITY_DN11102_c0_g4_i1:30-1454(+)
MRPDDGVQPAGNSVSGSASISSPSEDGPVRQAADVATLYEASTWTDVQEYSAQRQSQSELSFVDVALRREASQLRQRTYQQRGALFRFSAYRMDRRQFAVLGVLGETVGWFKQGEGCQWRGDDGAAINGSSWFRVLKHPMLKYDSIAMFCRLEADTPSAGGFLTATFDGVPVAVMAEQPDEPMAPPSPLPSAVTWCSQPMYGAIGAQRVWEWMAYHRAMASVDTWHFYDMGGWTPELADRLREYFDAGRATLTDLTEGARFGFQAGQGSMRFSHRHQVLSNNDCVFRSAMTAQWVTLHDMDEYLDAVPPHTIQSVLAKHADKPWLSHGAYAFEASYCDQSAAARPDALAIEKFVWRRKKVWCVEKPDNMTDDLCLDWMGHRKVIVNPRKSSVVSIHVVYEPNPGGAVLSASTELRHLHLAGTVSPSPQECVHVGGDNGDPEMGAFSWLVKDTTLADRAVLVKEVSPLVAVSGMQ